MEGKTHSVLSYRRGMVMEEFLCRKEGASSLRRKDVVSVRCRNRGGEGRARREGRRTVSFSSSATTANVSAVACIALATASESARAPAGVLAVNSLQKGGKQQKPRGRRTSSLPLLFPRTQPSNRTLQPPLPRPPLLPLQLRLVFVRFENRGGGEEVSLVVRARRKRKASGEADEGVREGLEGGGSGCAVESFSSENGRREGRKRTDLVETLSPARSPFRGPSTPLLLPQPHSTAQSGRRGRQKPLGLEQRRRRREGRGRCRG